MASPLNRRPDEPSPPISSAAGPKQTPINEEESLLERLELLEELKVIELPTTWKDLKVLDS